MPSSYVEVEIRADAPLVEELAGVLSQIGFEGFWEDGDRLKCYIQATRWDARLAEEVTSVTRLVLRTSASVLPEISIRTIEDQNWNAAWEATITPIQVTDRIVITPTWHTYTPTPGQIVIRIDPKMSFGTGYHESTRLILKLLEHYVRPGIRVLDVGTGTGVLAIAAVKLGAASAFGVDINEWSYENALENVKLNAVEREITIRFGSMSSVPPDHFEIIAANIQRSTIELILPEMIHRLASGGLLLLSGLLLDDRGPTLKTLRTMGLILAEELRENEWLALAIARE
jgi:ribosomal protein L11 methyltransferase